MKGKVRIRHFVYGRCEGVSELEKIATDWFKTAVNPCLICGIDQTKCFYYKNVVASGGIEEEMNTKIP